MPKALFTIILICVCIKIGFAQNRFPPLPPTPDENSIVKDANGKIYTYEAWCKLLTTGDYNMLGSLEGNDKVMTYVLVKRTEQEKVAMHSRLPKPVESEHFKSGDTFKPINDVDISGFKLNSKSMAGKVVVLNFWFIDCPPCRSEIPELNKVVDTFKDNPDVIFLAIALDGADAIKEFIKENPINYHIVENGRYYAQKYGVDTFPVNVVYNTNGKVIFSSADANAAANAKWLKRAINDALNQKTKQAAL